MLNYTNVGTNNPSPPPHRSITSSTHLRGPYFATLELQARLLAGLWAADSCASSATGATVGGSTVPKQEDASNGGESGVGRSVGGEANLELGRCSGGEAQDGHRNGLAWPSDAALKQGCEDALVVRQGHPITGRRQVR